jgi:hypothetical protein
VSHRERTDEWRRTRSREQISVNEWGGRITVIKGTEGSRAGRMGCAAHGAQPGQGPSGLLKEHYRIQNMGDLWILMTPVVEINWMDPGSISSPVHLSRMVDT